jgi:ABC-type antimicrobial peptide transport system permease subunit
VLDVGLTSAVPFRGTDFTCVLNRVGSTHDIVGNGRFVDAGFFRVMHVAPVRGRVFADSDRAGAANVAVISESYARNMFGADDPIGQAIAYDKPLTVVGIVGDVHYAAADKAPRPAIYLVRAQWPQNLICLVARTSPAAGDLGPAVRRVVHDLDPSIPAMNLTTLDQIVRDSVADRRFFTAATTAFAVLALLLTAIGLSVVVSRTVVERRRELAIRAALGAAVAQLTRLAAAQGLWPVIAGAALGLASTAAGATVLRGFLFGVAPRAPWAYALVAVVIVTVGAAACLIPARRATDASPASLLRAE